MSQLHPGGFRGRIKGRDHRARASTSIALCNRRGGVPHKHEREIARRQRQAGRL